MSDTVNMKRFERVNTNINLEDFAGKFLPNDVAGRFHTLDGSCVAEYLKMLGYSVLSFKDTGRNGEATTEDGFIVSTNGYVCKTILKTFLLYSVSDKYTLKNCVDSDHAKKKLFEAYGIGDELIFKVEESVL